MNFLQRYIAYIKDNPQGYWFKRKLYGWGWTPAKWQGWVILLIYSVVVLYLAFTIDDNSTGREIALTFFLPFAIATVVLISICYAKGERPKWQWGVQKDQHDQEKQDLQ